MSSTSIRLGFPYQFRALTMRWTTEGSCPRSRWVMAKQLKPFNLIWAERAITRQSQSLCPNYFGEFLRFVRWLLAKPACKTRSQAKTKNQQRDRRNQMKSSTLLMIGLVLVGAALMPATCRAQSEVDPDHFEMTNVDPIPQPTNIGPEQTQTGVEGRENYDQRCSNFKTLQNGEVKRYAFSVRPPRLLHRDRSVQLRRDCALLKPSPDS